MTDASHDFNNLLLRSINRSLETYLGQDVAKSVAFYVDTSIAVADAGHYARSLEKMFGQGANLLLEKMVDDLSLITGIPKDSSKGFKEYILSIKKSTQV